MNQAAPVFPGDERPLVTFALFAYNQKKFIREAVEGAFAQTYEPLEIILSDDCSTDETFEIIKEMAAAYSGRHKVIVRRSPVNRGLGSHVNDVFTAARGEFIVLAAGDDVSIPGRVEKTILALAGIRSKESNSILYSSLSTLLPIDEHGNEGEATTVPKNGIRVKSENFGVFEFDLKHLLCGDLFTSGPSRVIPRKLYEIFGNLREDCFTEDIVYLFRSVLAGHVAFLDCPTVRYRKHGENLSTPETLYSKSFDGVAKQLFADLETARALNLISNAETSMARRWIEENIAFRSFYRAHLRGHRPALADMKTILLARYLKPRRKFGLLREFIGLR